MSSRELQLDHDSHQGHLFDLTFEALKQSLNTLQRKSNDNRNQEDVTVSLDTLERKLLDQVWSNLKQAEYKKLGKVQEQHHFIDQRYRNVINLEERSLEQIHASLQRMLSSCLQQQTLASLRITQQHNVSERRLQDLMMEVIGEYGKTLTRSRRREESLLLNSRIDIIMTTWNFLWKRFIVRMRFDILNRMMHKTLTNNGSEGNNAPSQNLHSKLFIYSLSPQQDHQEFHYILKKLNKRIGLISDQTFVPYSIIRITKNTVRVANLAEQGRPSKSGNISIKDKQSSPSFTNHTIKIANHNKDLLAFLDEIYAWVAGSSGQGPNHSPRSSSSPGRILMGGTSSGGLFMWKELLSNISFSWQMQNMMSSVIWDEVVKKHSLKSHTLPRSLANHLDEHILQFTKSLQFQYDTSIFSNRVYFCLEERSLAQSGGLLNTVHKDIISTSASESGAMHLDFLTALQELYVDYPHTMATCQSSTLLKAQRKLTQSNLNSTEAGRSENLDIILIELQRMFQSHPFQLMSFENKHHHIHRLKFPISKRHDKNLLDELSCVPTILKVKSLVDESTVLHFAPASILVLFEALHSYKSGVGFVPTLFCPILKGSVDKMSLLNPGTNNSTETAGSSLSHVMSLMNNVPHSHMTDVDSNEQSSTECDNSSVFLFPLNESCMESLETCYFPNQRTFSCSSNNEMWSCLRVLPDEARRVGVIGKQRQSASAGNVAEANSGDYKLSSSYVLMSDENSWGISKSTDSNELSNVVGKSKSSMAAQVNHKTSFSTTLDVEQTSYDDETFEEINSSVWDNNFHWNSSSAEEWVFQHTILHNLKQLVAEDCLVFGNRQVGLIQEDRNTYDSSVFPTGSTVYSSKQHQVQQVDQQKGEVSAKKSSTTSWDSSVLSQVCYWRSCMCDTESLSTHCNADSPIQSANLCFYHLEMKKFLDSKASKGSNLESSKYLPKKPPSFANQPVISVQKKDLMVIRAASTLLQELWDGRLKSTVKLFAKKMMSDMKFRSYFESQLGVFMKYHGAYLLKQRKRLCSSSSSSKSNSALALNDITSLIIPSPPTWTLWKNREYLERTTKGQSLSLELLNYIFSSEQLISHEIVGFIKLQCFPSQELNIIRRDIKAFKDQQELMLSNSQYLSANDQLNDSVADKRSGRKAPSAASGGDSNKSKDDDYENLVAILEEESKLCERKLQILSQRREFEEESRLHALRKVAKMKALEDVQAKDPNNFKNQSSRF